jgi:hypothetical protein
MAKEGLLALICANAILPLALAQQASPTPGDDTDKTVATTLAVQTALQKGKEHLLREEYGAAVDVLESQLPYIDGNRVYLNCLKDAYRRYIKELRLAKQDTDAKRYLNRLLLLDRGAILDKALTESSNGPVVPPGPRSLLAQLRGIAATKPANRTAPTVRAKGIDEEPAQTVRSSQTPARDAKAILAEAEQEFAGRRFKEAGLLYERAYQADPVAAKAFGERWAYCKLSRVVEELNRPSPESQRLPELEQEIRVALSLAPRLSESKEVKELVNELDRRRGGNQPAAAPRDGDLLPVRHLGPNAEGWIVSESSNFRIFHHSEQVAEQAAKAAEQSRVAMQQKWFGGAGAAWNPKCDIYLHPTADAYGRATGQYNSPGHSTLRMERGRLIAPRIDLHCDDANMLTAILPHETTHVVLAAQFGELPRWADEGMAVLTEPADKVERHLSNLSRCRQDGQIFRLQDLMQLDNYPQNPRYISAFYAQSVSLVDYLTSLRGPQEFGLFMHDGMRYGYEKALQRHYQISGFADLERRWSVQSGRTRAGLARASAE